MISGDKNLVREGTSARERFLLQKSQVETLELVIWPQDFFKPLTIQGQFDVVTSQDPFWRGLIALVAARRHRARLNVQLHANLRKQSWIKRLLAKIVLARADSVRVVSNALRDEVAHLTRAPVSVLPVYIDLSRFVDLQREPRSQPQSVKTILWIGRFEDEKDPLLALETLRAVRGAGIDAQLVMLGSGSLEEDLRKKMLSLGLTKNIEFPGWQDPLQHLKKADVVLCTSQAESFGASIVEALAAGVPVVAPDVGVAREAGAVISERTELPQKTIEILQENTRGHLQILLPTREKWAELWKETL
jgi:glycosyltransferase involved in cell wall biosynthesis